LTGLALLHIHYNIDTDFDKLIQKFAMLHPRRMELANNYIVWLTQKARKGHFR